MDKYIDYSCDLNKDPYNGLNLLCDPRKMKKEQLSNYVKNIKEGKSEIKFIDRSYLDNFKDFIKNKIDDFNPTIKKDNFDILLISLWYHYIFSNTDEDKYVDFIKVLNKNYV